MRISGIETFRAARRIAGAVAAVAVLLPLPAVAQSADDWEVNVAPFYFWAASISGQMDVRNATVPFSMDFSQAADHLSGAFTFYFDARKGRWGVFTNIDFVGLSTSTQFTTPGIVLGTTRTVDAELDLDQTIFEISGTYLISKPAKFSLIGGLRTFTVAPSVSFTGAAAQVTPIDVSDTSVNAFGGFMYRPKIARKWTFASRADIGGGEAKLTWSAMAAVEFTFKPWIGVGFGYKALYIDTGDTDKVVSNFDVTNYGPLFGITLHWGGN